MEPEQVSRTSSHSLYGSHPTLRRSSEVQEYDFPPSPSPSRHSQQQQQQQQLYDQQNEQEGLFVEHDYEFIDDNYFDAFQLEERINVLSRFPDYPFSNVKRDYVPDSKVTWSVSYFFLSFAMIHFVYHYLTNNQPIFINLVPLKRYYGELYFHRRFFLDF